MAITYKYAVKSEEDLQAYLDTEAAANRVIVQGDTGLTAITDKGFGSALAGSGASASNHRKFDVVTSDQPLPGVIVNGGTTTKAYFAVPEADVQSVLDTEGALGTPGLLMVRRTEWTKGGTRQFDLVFVRFA